MTHAAVVGRCIAALQGDRTLRRATVFISPIEVVKATRQRPADRRYRHDTFIVTAGVPNFRERRWIRVAKRAGEPFPVRRVQLTAWPKKRAR